MASFPASPASSSDLYPNSEPTGESQTNPLHPHSPNKERIQLGLKDPQPDVGASTHLWSSDTKVPPDLQNFRHGAVHASSEISTHISGAFDGNPPHGPHKRKRESDDENLRFVQGKPSSQDLVENLPYLPKIANLDSLKSDFPNGENGASPDNFSSNKRTKSNDVGSGSVSKTSSTYRSPGLPAELWQYIFCFVPPISLGRLLRVDHAFNAYLTPSDSNEQDVKRTIHGIARPLNPETVWASSRRRFCPGLPKPMRGLKELDMWKLFRGHNCQVCGEPSTSSPVLKLESPWESGPGEIGIRVIWPWGVRVCGQCIQKCSEKEVDLLFSSVSALLPALPFAFISISNHYIASTAIRSSTPPPTLKLTKYYYKPHIEEIRQRLDHARGLGNASAEEWVKGLDSEGKERLNEVTRWEQWEAKGGLRKVNLRPHPKAIVPPGSAVVRLKANKFKSEDIKCEAVKQDVLRTEHMGNEDSKKDGPLHEHIKNGLHSDRSTPQGVRFPIKLTGESSSLTSSSTTLTPYLPPNATTSFQPSWTSSSAPHSENLLPHQQASFQPLRYERNIRDVNQAKAVRKAEIERRCAALNPPLTSKVLAHMDTFQAAIQISQPLTDQAWQVLKPRLLTQRAYAERREKEIFEQGQQLQVEYEQRRHQEAQLKETKESLDREWDNVQIPIRNQIARLADERIEMRWSSGKTVTKDNSPQFAADVLLYVRKRFYDEIAQEEEITVPASRNSRFDAGPPSRILILENMKWLFDTKVKPFTENFQKELFLCNGCDGNFKFYGLESVVQHYAAKHTTALSCGPQVVSWRAEWPEHPLFHPKPSVAQADYYKIPPPLSSSLQAPIFRDSETSSHFSVYGPAMNPLTQATSRFSPAPSKDSYIHQQQQNGHHSPFDNQNHFRPGLHNPGKPYDFPQSSDLGVGYPSSYASYNGFRSPSIPAAQVTNYQAPVYNLEPSRVHDPKMSTWHEPEFSALISHPVRPPTSYSHYVAPNGDHFGQTASIYQSQLDEMARHARDVWSSTSGIKDIPQSVRIFVVIQQMVIRFKKTFPNGPSLGMFVDVLDHNVVMKPIRNQKGLACKVCVTSSSSAGGGQSSYAQPAVENRWLYHLPQLLNHFKTAHLDSIQSIADPMVGIESQTPDWKFDMIELPESHLIAALINAPGMDDAKLELIARVFPGVFPSPLPRIGAAGNAGPVPIFQLGFDRGRPSQAVTPEAYPDSPPRMEPRNETQPFNRPYSGFRELSQPARSSEPPGEDEYDPHRPAFLGKIVPSGTSILHTQKPSRNTSTGNSESSPLRPKHDDYSYMRPSVAPSTYNGPPHRGAVTDNRNDPHTGNPEGALRSVSPERHVQSLSGVRFNHEPPNGREHSLREPNLHDNTFGANASHGHISEDGEVKDSAIFLNPRERTLSPQEGINAANKFLDNLSTISNLGVGRNFGPPDHEEYQPTSQPQELSQDLHPQIKPDTAIETSDWRTNVSRRGRDNDLPTSPLRTDSSKVKKYDELVMPQKPASNHEHEANYRSRSILHRPLNESLVSRRSPDLYTTYEAPSRKIVQDRYEMSEAFMEAPRPGDGSFHVTRTSQYRSRSKSPRPISMGTTYYRARTPVNEGRLHDTAYHIHSPPLRTDIRPQRIISYDYPAQDRYEYVDDRRPSDNPIRQRVEYVPVRVGEHAAMEPSRFVIAQPVEMRPQPDYVRFDRGYNGEPVYERHGQLYHADPRPYHAPQSHNAPAFAQGYRY